MQKSLKVLGGAAILDGAALLSGPAVQRHRLALLALLASGRPMSRDKLMAYLWPERDTDSARNLLKVAVHELRKALGDDALRTAGALLTLDLSVLPSDLAAFESAGSRSDDEAAARAYAGPFLDGFFLKDAEELEHWIDAERARLASAYGAALRRLATRAEADGRHDRAADWWRALASHDPLDSEAATGVMRALAAEGDRAGALRHADAHARARRDSLGIELDPQVQQLVAALHDEPRFRYTPPAVAALSPPAISEPSSAFVGRRLPPRRRALAIALVIIASIAAALTAALAAITLHRPPANSARTLALEPAMARLLSTRLAGVAGLDLVSVPPTAIHRDWTPDQARAAAAKLGATLLLIGDTTQGLSATVYRVSDGAVVARATSNDADHLAAGILARLDGEHDERVPDLMQRPLAAVQAYLAGRDAYRVGRYAAAESLYARALDVDSTFALAGLGLSMSNSWNGINEHYGRGRDAAWTWQDRLTPRDRAFVQAWFGPDPALGRPLPAPVYLKRWEDVVEKWPDWAKAWYEVGDRYYHFGGLSGWSDPSARALAAFRRATQLDSLFAAPLHHLAEIYAARGDTGNLRRTATRYFAANPHVSRDASAIGWEVAVALGDSAWVARTRASFPAMSATELDRVVWVTEANGWNQSDARRALDAEDRKAGATNTWRENALALRWAMELNAGHAAAAHQAALGIEALTPDQPVAALWDMLATLFGGADTSFGAAAAPRLDAFAGTASSQDDFRNARREAAMCLSGFWNEHHGNTAGARAVDAELHRALATERTRLLGQIGNASECLLALDASIAMKAHAASGPALLARLDTMLLRDRVPPRLNLDMGTIVSERLHEAAGEPGLALAAARRREHLTGDPFFLSTELLAESRLAMLAGDHDGAARAYRQYLALRKPPR